MRVLAVLIRRRRRVPRWASIQRTRRYVEWLVSCPRGSWHKSRSAAPGRHPTAQSPRRGDPDEADHPRDDRGAGSPPCALCTVGCNTGSI